MGTAAAASPAPTAGACDALGGAGAALL